MAQSIFHTFSNIFAKIFRILIKVSSVVLSVGIALAFLLFAPQIKEAGYEQLHKISNSKFVKNIIEKFK